MSTTIESLELQVQSSSQSAQSGLDALTNSLSKLKSATKGGIGLTAVVNQVNKLNSSMNSLSSSKIANLKDLMNSLSGLKSLQGVKVSSTIAKSITEIGNATSGLNSDGVMMLRELAPALNSLSSIGNVKISSTVGKGIASIVSATNSINVSELSKIKELADAVSSLASIRDVKISSSIATQVVNLAIAAEMLQGVDLSIFGNLAEALVPLSTIERANLNSTINQLKKIPEVATALNTIDLDTFSDRISRIASALQPLATQMNAISSGFAAFPQRIQTLITSTNSLASANNSASSSYMNLYARLKMASSAVRGIASKIASWIENANSYIEDINLFNASMGQFAKEAANYANKVADIMGIDPGEWMRNQGVFMTLADGFGVAGDRAYTMSQQLTQLGYDLSSFFNITVADAMQKLQSGLAGELEPLRRLGYDLSQARLEAIALSLGINKTYTSMTQAEKSQLRYYAIMTQVTTAQGDMARTLDAPANQLRVLQAQVTQAARAFGSVFIPILNAVLPVVIAVAKAIRILASAIASLFGFSLPDVDYSGITDYTGGVGDLGDALDSAGGSAKKLKSYLMGFDELNVINPDDNSGGGSGGGGGGSAWDWDLPVYDFLGDAVATRVDELMKKFEPVLSSLKEHLSEVLAIVSAIGVEWGLWKMAKSLLPNLGSAREHMEKILGIVTTLATAVITVALVYHFDNAYMKSGAFGYLIADGIATGLGAAISGAVMKNQFGAAAGLYTAGAVVAVSALTSIKVIYDSVSTGGFSGNTVGLGIMAGVKGAIAGGIFAKALGLSLAAGAGLGFVIAAALTITATLIGITVKQNALKMAAAWGKVTLTATEMEKVASNLFSFDVKSTIKLATTTIENEDSARETLNDKITTFNSNLNLIKLGVVVDDSDGTLTKMLNQLTGEGGILDSLQSLLSTQQKTIELAVSLVPPKDEEGNDLSLNLVSAIGLSDDMLNEATLSIGEQLSEYISKGIVDGLNDDEKFMVAELSGWLNRIETAVAQGKISGEFGAGMNILLSDLTKDSFQGVLTSYQSMVDELTESYTLLEKQAHADAAAYAAGLTEAKAYYDSIGDTVNAQKTQEALDAVNEQIENWDILSSVQTAVDAATEPGKTAILTALQEIFGGAMGEIIEQRPFTDLSTEVMNGLFVDMTPENATEWSEGVARRIEQAIKQAFGDDYEIVMSVANMFNLTGWDLLTADIQSQIFTCFEDAFGSKNAITIFNDLGYEMSGVIAAGVASGAYQVKDEAGNLVVKLKDGTEVALGKKEDALVALFKSLGCDLVDGTVLGVDTQMSAVAQTLADLFGIPYEKAAEENQVNSPSKLFKQLGIYIVEGLIQGLDVIVKRLETTWSTLPSWFQNMVNIIISKFTGMSVDVGELFDNTKEGIQSSWSTSSFTTIGLTAIRGLIKGLGKKQIPALTPMVKLVKSGWSTVTSWVHNLFGNTDNDERISLLKSGWSTVTSWVKSLTGNTDLTQKINIAKGNWAGKTWREYLNFSYSTVTQKVDVTKGSWITLPSDKTVSYKVNLTKGTGIGNTIKNTLKNVFGISLWADGGFPTTGQMFIAREAGPELVGNIGGRSAVANNDQIVEAVSMGVYQAVSAAMSSGDGDSTRITINLDGEKIYDNQQKIARNRGYDLGMGAFSHG